MGVPAPLRETEPREQLRRLAYIGRLDSDKRVRDAVPLLRALAQTDIEFHFAGSGPDAEYLREELRDSRVVFHGDLTREKLYESMYPQLDAIVIFSDAETGPIVAWEAMRHGVVPITSDYVGRREENVIRDGETGLVFPVGDLESAANAIRGVTAPGSLRELSRRARAELPEAYTQAAFERTWDEALRAALAVPPRRGTAADLPSLVSPGLLARLGLGIKNTSRLRHLLGRSFAHVESGSEWPH